ncbi:MAG: toxin-antitoxin system HicB family antitoxin [Abitibacteriaceae bacterium]|nr:toxin-antitoxin system HicB family antitoxin [Abditibacteriaceae bacterium]
MKTLQVRLPDSVHRHLKGLAKREGVSLNQVLVTAASNEVVRQETRDFFAQASAEFDPQAFAAALNAVPDVEPIEGDQI